MVTYQYVFVLIPSASVHCSSHSRRARRFEHPNLSMCACSAQRLAGGPDLPQRMEEMDRELRQLQQQVTCSVQLLLPAGALHGAPLC